MKKDFLLSTGDVVEILHPWVSRSTVSRYFDKGILKGIKNPVTGKRMVNFESVVEFSKKYNIDIETNLRKIYEGV